MARRPEYDPLVDDLSVERRAAQLVVPVLDLRRTKDNDPDASYEQAEKWLDDLGVGGFILFGGDERTTKRLEALKRPGRGPAAIGPIISSDLERGLGQQVKGGTNLPPLMALGASRDAALAQAAGALTGREARAVGIDWVFAPVLDLADLADNPIIQARAFGSDPALVTELGVAWAKGLEQEDVVSCAKHFPGHGGTTQDSHDALPRVARTREVLEARDLAPFHAAAAHVRSFMTAHVAYPALAKGDSPATVEPRITEAYLRKAWRYDGIVSTDALIMSGLLKATDGDEGKAAVLALEAGCDVLLYPKDPRAVVRSIAAWARTNGQPARARLQDAVGRVLHLKRQLGLAGPAHHRAPRRSPGAAADPTAGARLAQQIAEAAVTRLGATHPPLGKGHKVLVVTIDDDGAENPGLDVVLELQPRVGETRATTLGPDATDAQRTRALGLVAGVDRVVATVLCRTRAWKGRAGLAPAHAASLRALGAAKVPLTVVGLCSPYVLGGACPKGSEALLVYGDDVASQRAAAATLLGAAAPGTLPVEGLELFV